MMKYIALCLTVLLFSACSFKQGVEINRYALEIQNEALTPTHTRNKIVLIEFPKVDSSFNTQEMLYSTQPYTFQSYAKNRWLQLPSNMLFTALQKEFEHQKLFLHTITNNQLHHDYTLETHLLSLYHLYNVNKEESHALIEIKFNLTYNNQLIKSLYFKQKVLCKQNSPYGFVTASNEGIETIFKAMMQDLSTLTEQ